MKKEKVQKMFDAIASDYDKLNHIMSLDADKGWRRRALKYICDERSALQESGSKTGNASDGRQALQVLDVACGTGDFSITIARALPEGSRVTGIDRVHAGDYEGKSGKRGAGRSYFLRAGRQ